MNCKQIIAVSAIVLFALMLVPVADAATIENSPSGTVEVDNMNGGGFDFTLQSDNSFELTVTITENGRELSVQTFNVTPGENVIHVDLGMMTSVGNHTIRVECTPANEMEGGHGFNVNVEVTQNILSNWAVYGAIAIVVIIIVIFAYIKMRDTPKVKPEMTFEELEAQRKAEMAAKADKKQKKEKAPAPTTERKRYVAKSEEQPKAAEPKVAEEPKVKESRLLERKEKAPKMTFEELEAQKQAEKAKKAADKEKKKSSDKSERERYLEEKRKKKEQE